MMETGRLTCHESMGCPRKYEPMIKPAEKTPKQSNAAASLELNQNPALPHADIHSTVGPQRRMFTSSGAIAGTSSLIFKRGAR